MYICTHSKHQMFSRQSLGPNGAKSFKENIFKNLPKKTNIRRTFLIAYLSLEERIILPYHFLSELSKK